MPAARSSRRIAVVASRQLRTKLEAHLSGHALVSELPPSAAAPLRASYRRAAVALVGEPAAMPAAVLVQRWSKVPWCAVLDADALRRLRARRRSLGALVLGQAAVVVVEPALEREARELVPTRRIVSLDEHDRLERVLADTALADGGRRARAGPAALLADGWTFLNDRAALLAIRAMPLVGKAPQPIHPRHLVGGAWHLWFLPHLRAGDRVLDVGCGNGAHALAAARVARFVVGVDVDATGLDRARARAAAEGAANVSFRPLDLAEPAALEDLGRGEFDVVLALDVLEHVAERVEVLRRVCGLLRPGGRLLVSVPNRDTPYRRLLRRLGGFAFSDPDHKVEYTDESLAAELHEGGFEIVSRERGGYDSPFGGFSTLVGTVSLPAYAHLLRRRRRLSLRYPERATALRVVAVPRP